MSDLPTTVAEKVSVLNDLRAVTLTAQVRQERNVKSERGALIYEIGREAQQGTGLAPGDVVFQVNRFRVENAEDLSRAFRASNIINADAKHRVENIRAASGNDYTPNKCRAKQEFWFLFVAVQPVDERREKEHRRKAKEK